MPNISNLSSCESNPTNRKKVVILGSGPNRIGQGIEFDYTCVHAACSISPYSLSAEIIAEVKSPPQN